MLAAALSGGYEQHASAIAATLGGWPTITTPVPSTRGKLYAQQPLRHVIELVEDLRGELAPTLLHTSAAHRDRSVRADLFTAIRDLSGQRVLLVEDLWVRGKHGGICQDGLGIERCESCDT
jgi:hypothetical protein